MNGSKGKVNVKHSPLTWWCVVCVVNGYQVLQHDDESYGGLKRMNYSLSLYMVHQKGRYGLHL